jgi:hypothetical protein
VFFQSTFREADPMQAALDGFCEFFKCDDPHVEETAPLRPSDSVDFAALTVQFARNKSRETNLRAVGGA